MRHFSTSISLLTAGLGFAFLPRNWLQSALQDGSLQESPLEGGYHRTVPMYLMLSNRDTSGPATRAMAGLLEASLR